MSATNSPDRSLVEKSADGVLLISGSRIPLDTIVFWFHRGATAEEIADKYPSLTLATVYGSIAYYLNHRDEIDAYLSLAEAEQTRKRDASNGQPSHLRSRLLARMTAAAPT